MRGGERYVVACADTNQCRMHGNPPWRPNLQPLKQLPEVLPPF